MVQYVHAKLTVRISCPHYSYYSCVLFNSASYLYAPGVFCHIMDCVYRGWAVKKGLGWDVGVGGSQRRAKANIQAQTSVLCRQ